MWAYVPAVAPSPVSIGATSGLVTQFTLLGVLLSGPIFLSVLSAPTSTPIVIVLLVATVLCASRLPIVARVPVPRWPSEAPEQAAALAVRHTGKRIAPTPLDGEIGFL